MTRPLFTSQHSSSKRTHSKNNQSNSPSFPTERATNNDTSDTVVPKGRQNDVAKPRPTIGKTPRRFRGFEHMEQRLPESPPASDPSERSLMGILRNRTRGALEALFLPVCRILNVECDNHNSAGVCQSNTYTARRAPVSVSQPPRISSPSAQAPSPARSNDQVVPTPGPADEMCYCGSEIWQEGGITPQKMLHTASELAAVISTFLSETVDKQGMVNYSSILKSGDFARYLKITRKLRYFDPTLLSPSQRQAFFLNIYNALLIHAIAAVKKPKNKFDRLQLYSSAAYNIGGRPYTLNDIEHGVLRCNRASDCGFIKSTQFEEHDARLLCALPEPIDARIHFALNCGAKSCPPVRYYDPDGVSPALDNATRAFLLGVQVDGENNTVTLSQIFRWYRSDFIAPEYLQDEQQGNRQLLLWILDYLTDEAKINTLKRMIGTSIIIGDEAEREKESQHHNSATTTTTTNINNNNVFTRPTIIYSQYDWSVNDSTM